MLSAVRVRFWQHRQSQQRMSEAAAADLQSELHDPASPHTQHRRARTRRITDRCKPETCSQPEAQRPPHTANQRSAGTGREER